MAKRKDIKKVLIIGSGPIVIGQAAEFDYAGTQACRALLSVGDFATGISSSSKEQRPSLTNLRNYSNFYNLFY